MIRRATKISQAFCSISHGTIYLTFFDGTNYLGRLQIDRRPDSPTWKRTTSMTLAEGEVGLEAIRRELSESAPPVWDERLHRHVPDRLELHGSSGDRRLVLISPVAVADPTASDEVDAFNYLLSLRLLIGFA